jgi:hypothetical protein
MLTYFIPIISKISDCQENVNQCVLDLNSKPPTLLPHRELVMETAGTDSVPGTCLSISHFIPLYNVSQEAYDVNKAIIIILVLKCEN